MSVYTQVKLYTKEKITPEFIRSIFDSIQASGGKYDIETEEISIEKNIDKIIRTVKKPNEFGGYGCFFKLQFKDGRWPIYIGFELIPEGYNSIYVSIDDADLQPTQENERIFYNLIRELIKKTKPVFGIGDGEIALDELGDMENIGKYIGSVKIPYIPWLLFLGPDYLKKYGEEKLLKTPALIAEKIGSGVFIVVDYHCFGKPVKERIYTEKAILYLRKILGEGKKINAFMAYLNK